MAGARSLAEIVGRLGGECIGDPEVRIAGIATLRSAGDGDIVFLSHARHRGELATTRAAAVILAAGERDATTLPRIVCRDPYLYFAQVSTLFHPPAAVVAGQDPRATVAASARVAPTARVDAGAVIEAGAVIGAGAWIGANCWIGEDASIGAGTRLYGGVHVYHRCVLGNRAIVHSGAVIGADGFGFAADDGRWLKIPQIGRVVIGDDVEIGANTTIDRGALDDTVIEDGVKLDNQIQIAHNCRIGAHTAIAGCVGIAGSVTIGRHCMIGGGVLINGHITIADRVVLAGGTGVSKSISAPGMYASALPAAPIAEWRRRVALIRRLRGRSDRPGGSGRQGAHAEQRDQKDQKDQEEDVD